jgi:hypothetical protein
LQAMLFKQMPEMRQRCRVRHIFLEIIQPHEPRSCRKCFPQGMHPVSCTDSYTAYVRFRTRHVYSFVYDTVENQQQGQV